MPRLSAVSRFLNETGPATPFSLDLTWTDGTRQTVDLSGLVNFSSHFDVFAQAPDAFGRVTVINWGHGIGWENGLDYSAENLARIADEQTREVGPELMAAFKDRFKLTNEQAGHALGYKKSQIKNFRNGASKINPAVKIAIHTMMNDPTILYGRMGRMNLKKPG
jgi:hypothetical protein